MSALQIAMKIEGFDTVPMNPSTYRFSHEYTLAQYERKIVRALNFKLIPDTLFNWVDFLLDCWNSFAASQDL